MILIGFGSNLSHAGKPPRDILSGALSALVAAGVGIDAVSSLFETEPVPPKPGQPWYANAVAALSTDLGPADLLALLHSVEVAFGRVRDVHWSSRTLDLDLLAHGDAILPDPESWMAIVRSGTIIHAHALELPHPQMHLRRFVLAPLAEIAPGWRHPVLQRNAAALLAALPAGEGEVRRLPDVPLYKP